MLNKIYKRFLSDKKAQTEFIGIALIIVLLLLGMLIIYFIPSNKSIISEESKQGSNFLSALLETSTDCQGINIKALIQDCSFQHRIFCPERSCDYVKQQILLLLNQTFDENGINYLFNLTGEDIGFSKGVSCNNYDVSEYNVPNTEIKLLIRMCK